MVLLYYKHLAYHILILSWFELRLQDQSNEWFPMSQDFH